MGGGVDGGEGGEEVRGGRQEDGRMEWDKEW